MWEVIGQSRTVSLLQRGLEKNILAHAYLIVGPPHVGKMTLALNLAQALNCRASKRPCGECDSCRKIAAFSHADVSIIGLQQNENSAEGKLKKEISIEQIRDIQHVASLPPFEGEYKVFIIDGAECLSVEAANCLLKTLEEPVGKTVFILLTASEQLLLPTVVSRCQRLELAPVGAEEIEAALIERLNVEPDRAKLFSRLAHGHPGWAWSVNKDNSLIEKRDEELNKLINIISAGYEGRFAAVASLANQFVQNRGQVYDVLDLWLDFWRDLLLVKADCGEIINNIDKSDIIRMMAGDYSAWGVKTFIENLLEAKQQLALNANPRLVLEVLMLNMPLKERESGGAKSLRIAVKHG